MGHSDASDAFPPLESDQPYERLPSSQLHEPHLSSSCPLNSTPPPSYKPRRFLYFLYLHPQFSALHFFLYLMACFFTICLFFFMGSMTSSVLYSIEKDQGPGYFGRTVGALATFDELLTIPCVLTWGLLSDLIGRRLVHSFGFLIMGIALFLYPLSQNVYPHMLLSRLLFAIGGAACSTMLTAVLADCAGRLRGRIAGIVGVSSGLGAVFAALVLLRLPASFSERVLYEDGIKYAFFTTASMAVLFSILYFFLSNRAQFDLPASGGQERVSSSGLVVSTFQRFKTGFRLAKDWRVCVTYASGFVARANTVVVTSFFPLWVMTYYFNTGQCTLADPNYPKTRDECRDGFRQSSKLTSIANTILLVTSPFWGFIADRYGITEHLEKRISRLQSPTFPIFLACIFAALGYALLSTQNDPSTWIVSLCCVIIGIGEAGTVITSAAMVSASHIDPSIRGSVSGVYSFFGALGIIICSSAGGELFHYWNLAPFALIACLHVLVAVLSFFAMVFGPPLPPYEPSPSFFRRSKNKERVVQETA